MPSCVIDGHVNVITGHFFESADDLVTTGSNPITLTRYFNSGSSQKGELYDCWNLNLLSSLLVDHSDIHTFSRVTDRGVVLHFKGFRKCGLLKVSPNILDSGVINVCSPYFSGREHVLNKRIQTIEEGKRVRFLLKSPGGETLNYAKRKSERKYFLSDITRPNGCQLKYHYNDYKLNRITSHSKNGDLTAEAQIQWNDVGKNGKEVRVKCDDGKEVVYNISKMSSKHRGGSGKHRYCLTSVESNFAPLIQYQYEGGKGHKKERLVKKELPENRYLNVEYYSSGKKRHKVRALYAPVGLGVDPVLTYKFEYSHHKTHVYNAFGLKKTFERTKENRLSRIDEYDVNGKLYRSEKIYWGTKKSGESTFLKARALIDSKGILRVVKNYQYDSKGNILKECLVGNLSGTCPIQPRIDSGGNLVSNGGEVHVKTYQYDENNLVIHENDAGQTVEYTYYPQTALIKLKTISNTQGIKQRQYYEYDGNSSVILELTDDGSSRNINDLTNVTERRIKRIQSTQNYPKGMPNIVREMYLDLEKGKEVLISKKVNTFTKTGLLCREETYDCHDSLKFSREWVFDSLGNVLEETNPVGQKTYYKYDLNGNCLYKQTPNANFHTLYEYDFANRLIREEKVFNDGTILTQSYAYDWKGNKVQSTDIYGNVTNSVYDEFDRLIKIVAPLTPDLQGISAEKKLFYDECNHLTCKIDEEGWQTHINYNAYGKPTFVQNPDGSSEQIIYNLDGTVRETTDSAGTKTLFEYDYLKRKTREEKRSRDNEVLSSQQWIYNTFHLLEEIDALGTITSYRYDGAGRLISSKKNVAETLYFYDSLGRQNEKWDLTEPGVYRIIALEYNVVDQVIQETIKSNSGEIFIKKQYGYDEEGNRTHETIFTSSGPSTTRTYYDNQKQPLKQIAPDGTELLYSYLYDYRNELNQCVPYAQVVDPQGNIFITIKNTRGETVVEERKNIFGNTVQKSTFSYDLRGHLIEKKEEVILSSELIRTHCTAFEYDPMGRQTAIIEAAGEENQKITLTEYDARGQVKKIVKPNGVSLDHEYDPLGRLSELASSDGTIHVRYNHDSNHNIIRADDLVSHTTTERFYDPLDQMVKEVLANELQFEYGYDSLGRLKEFQLPDHSKINYEYDAGNLRTIQRVIQGKPLLHRYHYDLSGKIASTELMNHRGKVEYSYDNSLRPIGIRSPYWKMTAAYDSCGNLIKAIQSDFMGEASSAYKYDDLYQLTQEEGAHTHNYDFDSLGNRAHKDGISYDYNSLNQLKAQEDVAYQYDFNGNLITKVEDGKNIYYRYDALDRLIEVISENQKTAYSYDPFHRRLSRTLFSWINQQWTQTGLENFIYQGDKEIGTIEIDGSINQLKVMGMGCQGDIGAAVLLEIEGAAYIPLHDYRGSVCSLINAQNGNVVETYRYTSYGEEQVYDKDRRITDTTLNPWRFSSKRVDPETGWVFFGRRHYDPLVGRWTTPDPLWFVDGTNLYCYVNNRPTQFVDPEGLFLSSIFSILKNTLCSLFEWMSNGDINANFSANSAYVCAELPIAMGRSISSLDHRSVHFRPRGATYGPVHITGINGINNSLEDGQSNFEHVQKMSEGCSGGIVYNATHGLWDILESFINLLGINTRPVHLLHKEWNDYFNNCGDDGIIIHYCHSQGAIQTRNALKSYDPERRKRIHVIAVAPAAYIDKELCGSVLHFVSKWDVVPWIDFRGRWRNRENIAVLNKHPDASYLDHSFQSPTYAVPIKDRIHFIRKNFGDKKI